MYTKPTLKYPVLLFPIIHPEPNETCPICLARYSEDKTPQVTKLPCNHFFHSACIREWLISRARTCPVCRHVLQPSSFSRSDSSGSADGARGASGGGGDGAVGAAAPDSGAASAAGATGGALSIDTMDGLSPHLDFIRSFDEAVEQRQIEQRTRQGLPNPTSAAYDALDFSDFDYDTLPALVRALSSDEDAARGNGADDDISRPPANPRANDMGRYIVAPTDDYEGYFYDGELPLPPALAIAGGAETESEDEEFWRMDRLDEDPLRIPPNGNDDDLEGAESDEEVGEVARDEELARSDGEVALADDEAARSEGEIARARGDSGSEDDDARGAEDAARGGEDALDIDNFSASPMGVDVLTQCLIGDDGGRDESLEAARLRSRFAEEPAEERVGDGAADEGHTDEDDVLQAFASSSPTQPSLDPPEQLREDGN